MDIQYHTELTEITEKIRDLLIFCAFRGFCVTFTHLASRLFLPHTEHTERTEFIIFALTLSVRSVPSV